MQNEYGEEIRRLFVPGADPGRYHIPRNNLIVYNARKGVSQLRFQAHSSFAPYRDESTMVIHIDGACRGNGTRNARAAYGIYFGPNSPYNTWGLVPAHMPQTSTRAEIEALAHALPVLQSICSHDLQLSDIKIATDSAFLVRAMSEWMEGWIANDGITANGRRVAHFERLWDLHDTLDEMEYGDDGGIVVSFWYVGRERNRAADALANAALDE